MTILRQKINEDGKDITIIYKKIPLFFGFGFYKKIGKITTINTNNSLDFDGYTKFAKIGLDANSSNNISVDVLYCAVGMSCEVGETIDHINKHVFHSSKLNKTKLISELGDLMWYTTNLMRLLNIRFEDVLDCNMIKLNTRYPNGRTKGIVLHKDHNKEDEAINNNLNKNQSDERDNHQ